MTIALIGCGAIARYVTTRLTERGHHIAATILRPERVAGSDGGDDARPRVVSCVSELPAEVDHVIDCAGHPGLHAHGPAVLRGGRDLTTLATGALADTQLHDALAAAARAGGGRLRLASGAIGALDVLRAARVGGLASVRYVGRKPPQGWAGSPAEEAFDLSALRDTPRTHFSGSARAAATLYPRNANVAAAVALAGVGFDDTRVELVADPRISANIHEVYAEGAFGDFDFRIRGTALADNPRSSALAAMSVVSTVEQRTGIIVF